MPLLAQESYRDFERGLNLSESQRAQVEGINKRYMGEWRVLRMESARKRLELWQIRRFQPNQWERAERVQREMDQIEAEKQRLFRQYRDEVSTVFNEEQRERFNKFMVRENRRPFYPPRYANPRYGGPPYGNPPDMNPPPYRFHGR